MSTPRSTRDTSTARQAPVQRRELGRAVRRLLLQAGFRTVAFGRLTPNGPRIEAALERLGVGSTLEAVVPVHSHYDHAQDSAEVARRTGGLLIGGSSTANIGRGADQALPYAVDDLNHSARRVIELARLDGVSVHFPTLWRREDPWAAS